MTLGPQLRTEHASLEDLDERIGEGGELRRAGLTERDSTMSDEQVAPETRGVVEQLLATMDLGDATLGA
jgi:hypothetical protein